MKPSKIWKSYWRSEKIKRSKLRTRLTLFQIPVYFILRKIIKRNNLEFILSTGAGQDVISFNLQRRFKNKLKMTISDISEDVLDWDKKLFNKYSFDAQFIKADIFKMPFKENSFDLIFNTGVLEHFKKDEQIKMIEEILRVLKPSGYFITANPSNGGRIYKLGMRIAKRKGTWPFGEEIPIRTLQFLKKEISEISCIKEYHKDFLIQIGFLSYIHPWFKVFNLPIRICLKLPCITYVTKICDFLFTKIFGTYLIISIIKKK